jgi:CheY-like chemotaxis protein
MTRPYVVLVADDDMLVRNFIHAVLTRSGYSVLMAVDGQEALDVSRDYPGEIHLLLSDIVMPRMNGFNLAERIREERPETRALLISGRTSSEIPAASSQFYFLSKPFVPAQLKAKLQQIFSDGNPNAEEI